MRIEVDDGVGLAVELVGDGPLLVCVHGLGGSGEDFADHVAALATRTTVAVVDLRGHGQSDRAEDYSLDRLARDVVAVADALGAATFRLVGHSMGGMVARRVAVDALGRVDAVVFMSTAAGPPAGLDPVLVDAAAELALADWDALRVALDEARPLGTPAFERLRATRPGFADHLDRRFAQCDPRAWAALAPAVARESDRRAPPAAVACPALVQVGVLDAAFLAGSRALAAAVPGAVLAEIADAGHHPHLEAPAVWLAGIEAWLDRTDVTAPGGNR